MLSRVLSISLLSLGLAGGAVAQQADKTPWVVYPGSDGPGQGKHIVFVSGDEEYRSEEALPMLARILAYRHGFKSTVLFAIHPETGQIDPEYIHNIPGLHHLQQADLMVIFTRWRALPDEQMRYIEEFTNSGKPIIALRTATHPFRFEDPDFETSYRKYDSYSEVPGWEGGWGRQVVGETWVYHHGNHGHQGTRGLVNYLYRDDPILNGVSDNVYGDTDVYGLTKLPNNAEVLLYGLTLDGLEPDSPPAYKTSIVPIAWRRTYTGQTGNTSRVFATTMGAATDFKSEGLRRLLVNAVFWGLEMEGLTPDEANVDYVGSYEPSGFGFGEHQGGTYPEDLEIDPAVLSEYGLER